MVLKCDYFEPLCTINDSRFIFWLTSVQQELDWQDYELWIYGGILDKPRTRDLDASLIGPWDPIRIRQLLTGMYQKAFELNIEPDIKYQTRQQMTDEDSSKQSAYPPDMLIMGNKRTTCGKLGRGNLRWKTSPIRNPKTRKQVI